MHLVEMLLPLSVDGQRFDSALYEQVRHQLTDRFGGMTGFGRSPAQGTFREHGSVVHDNIVVYEVMVEHLDREWWSNYRATLEKLFAQDEIVIRARRSNDSRRHLRSFRYPFPGRSSRQD